MFSCFDLGEYIFRNIKLIYLTQTEIEVYRDL